MEADAAGRDLDGDRFELADEGVLKTRLHGLWNHAPAVGAGRHPEAAVGDGGVVQRAPGGHKVHGKQVAPGPGILMPSLGRSVIRRLHEDLVEVELDVLAAEQVGDDIDKPGVAHVGQHDVVVVGHLVDLADGEGAVFRQRGPSRRPGSTWTQSSGTWGARPPAISSARSLTAAMSSSDRRFSTTRNPSRRKLFDLRKRQGVESVGVHWRSPESNGASGAAAPAYRGA